MKPGQIVLYQADTVDTAYSRRIYIRGDSMISMLNTVFRHFTWPSTDFHKAWAELSQEEDGEAGTDT